MENFQLGPPLLARDYRTVGAHMQYTGPPGGRCVAPSLAAVLVRQKESLRAQKQELQEHVTPGRHTAGKAAEPDKVI